MWEHQTVKNRNLDVLENYLDDQGQDGWELVSVVFNTMSEYVAFMRRKTVEETS